MSCPRTQHSQLFRPVLKLRLIDPESSALTIRPPRLLRWPILEIIFFIFFCQGVGETNGRRPTNGDLAGFWDMVMIQVKSIQL